MARLKNVLFINAASSAATALLLVVFPGFFASLFGVSTRPPFIGVGIFLLLFAIYVFLQSRNEQAEPNKIRFIIALDIIWVVGSLAIILPQFFGLTVIGYSLIGGVALWVAMMAYLQTRGLKALS